MKILHIFPPSLKTRFGGQNVTWKYNFNAWDDPSVEHYCLDSSENQVQPATAIFDFDYPSMQFSLDRVDRFLWIFRLFKNLRRHADDYDVIHFHILWWGGLLAARWAKKRNIPTIYESILLDADTPSGILKQSCGKLKVALLRNFSCILAISDFLAQDYLKNGFSQEQVVTLVNSVDTTLFHPLSSDEEKAEIRRRVGLPVDATIIIFVGSIIHRKGVDVLVEAFTQMNKSNHNLYLLLVGPHTKQENPSIDENWINHLQNNLAEANLTSKVNFLGLVSERNHLAELYKASDAFMFPSRKEGLGNVILEAMASGLPVITSDLDVFEGLVQNDVNGLTIPVEDANNLAQAGLELIDNPQRKERYSNKAREDTIGHFSFSVWQAKLIEVYNNLIQRKIDRMAENQ